MKYFLIALLTINLSCSLKSTPVNKAPVGGRTPMGKPTDDHFGAGEMGPREINLDVGNNFSIFLWPNSPKMPLDKVSEEVSLMSREIDRLTKSFREATAKILHEQFFWSAWACDAEADKANGNPSVQDCASLFPNNTKHDFCSCLANNIQLIGKQNEGNIPARLGLGEKIMTMVEDDDDINTKNWLLGNGDSANRSGSILRLEKQGDSLNVYLKLTHFGPEDITYKTPKETPTKIGFKEKIKVEFCDDGYEIYTKKNGTKVCIPVDTDDKVGRILYVEYNEAQKSLSFAIIEEIKGERTGNVYYFFMERGNPPEGASDLVRFKGNFQKVGLLGQTLGIGAAKFDGDWIKASVKQGE
ncbi:MAG: hypothetical protein A4S09_01155 [Proteobacteria bacterium SG_bin7]|nr:MAG: hypothetical protein A4S09_01155 [Proteobacteria bacterium SG_bin7]